MDIYTAGAEPKDKIRGGKISIILLFSLKLYKLSREG